MGNDIFTKTRVLERYQEGIIFLFSLFNWIAEQRIKKSLADCFYALAKVQNAQFAAYLRQDYLIQQASYANILNHQRQNFLKKIQYARKLVQYNEKFSAIFSKIENLYEIICSLHLLKFRVNEYSVFEISKREMQGIEKASTNLLITVAKNKKIDTAELLDEIHLFETLFNRTLQIVVRDPVVFLFFIQDLYAFNSVIASI